jgi:hypothetical protein
MAITRIPLTYCLIASALLSGSRKAAAVPPPPIAAVARVRVPGGVPPWSGGNVNYDRPPAGFGAAVVWMQAVHDSNQRGEGRLEVDWIRLHATVGGRDVIVARDEYNDQKVCGGLYTRYPWFASDRHDALPASFDAKRGLLVLHPSRLPRKVYHWWNCQRGALPAGSDACWAEARLRIHGSAAVQVGLDYWKNLDIGYGGPEVNNKEAASSRWFFADPAWQIIKVAKSR